MCRKDKQISVGGKSIAVEMANRVSLAWRGIAELSEDIVKKYSNVKELDLSNNKLKYRLLADSRYSDLIRSLELLGGFKSLKVLVLDGNFITEHCKIPRMQNLDTLWVNRNNIGVLTQFIDKLVESVPDLRQLSLLNNDACPNYFNGGTLAEYNDYRHHIARICLIRKGSM